MKFYEVTAKCGHVGGVTKYILINYYVVAENASKAAAAVRKAPRVKHHHSDAIKAVVEITAEEYTAGRIAFDNDPYNLCHNIQEQRCFESIAERIMDDDERIEWWENRSKKKKSSNPKRAYKFGYDGNKKVTRGAFNYDIFDSSLTA